jgi:dihydropteroate synthase
MNLSQPYKGFTRIGNRVFTWGTRTFVMGILNVTPDSFSGDGVGTDLDIAIKRAVQIQQEGADLIDIGGESSRPVSAYPEAKEIPAQEEIERIMPVIQAVASRVDIPISVDTWKAEVAQSAIQAGASLVNDIWGFKRDQEIAPVVAKSGVPAVLMHNQNGTTYADLVPDVMAELGKCLDIATNAGIPTENIILDPGIGFGKTAEHNLEIQRRLSEFTALGRPILMGTSRKSTIGLVLGLPEEDRVEGTAATVALSVAGGADIVRVHDVKEMVRVVRMSDAVVRGWSRDGS